ncbi:MAG: hypothetical protein Q4D41_07960 [Prevotellaceae bacterium]|nr:hypothetical protein [Prevotellaceae bacterium]
MDLNFRNVTSWLILLACLFLVQPIQAQTKPRWATKGVSSMNKDRSNDSYEFVNVESFGADINVLRKERLTPIIEKLAEQYQLSVSSAKIDTVLSEEMFVSKSKVGDVSVPSDYRITFTGADNSVFYLKLVDDYTILEDYADETYYYELYQLYAVSKVNTMPEYDEFKISNKYKAGAMAMSIVPGVGQIYKGQNVKGYAIIGSEAFLLGSAIIFELKRDHCADNNWKSKARGWRQFRDIALVGAGLVYVYNLIDAAVSDGSRHVTVKKKKDVNLTFAPMVSTEGSGLSFVLNF